MKPESRPGFTNHYVFAKVLKDNSGLCKDILEVILGNKLGNVSEVSIEEETASVLYRDARFDALLVSAEAAYNLEMQRYFEPDIALRARFLHSHIARRLLKKGEGFRELRPAYVIFICTYDPLGLGLPVYTFRAKCEEVEGLRLGDGATTIFLNASADLAGIGPDTADLLNYVQSGQASEGKLSDIIDAAVDAAFEDEEWAMGIWTFEDEMYARTSLSFREGEKKGEAKGRAEGFVEGEAKGKAAVQKHLEELLSQMKAQGKSSEEILAAIEAGI